MTNHISFSFSLKSTDFFLSSRLVLLCLQFASLSHFGNVPEKNGSIEETPRAKKEVNLL